MNYCSECGRKLEVQNVAGRVHPVYFCAHCTQHFYHHPKLLVASFIHCGEKLLWMRRALDPQKGHWAIPAGFMEAGETLQQAAARELYEETNVTIAPSALQLYMMGTISFISEVYVAFHGEVQTKQCSAGEESLEVAFFSRQELPWGEVAYPEANNSIIQAYDNLEQGRFNIYHAEMTAEKNSLEAVNPHT